MPPLIMKLMSTMCWLLPKRIIRKRTLMMKTMMPHCLEHVLLPNLSEPERGEFIARMINILMLGASREMPEGEWEQLINQMRSWTGSLDRADARCGSK